MFSLQTIFGQGKQFYGLLNEQAEAALDAAVLGGEDAAVADELSLVAAADTALRRDRMRGAETIDDPRRGSFGVQALSLWIVAAFLAFGAWGFWIARGEK